MSIRTAVALSYVEEYLALCQGIHRSQQRLGKSPDALNSLMGEKLLLVSTGKHNQFLLLYLFKEMQHVEVCRKCIIRADSHAPHAAGAFFSIIRNTPDVQLKGS